MPPVPRGGTGGGGSIHSHANILVNTKKRCFLCLKDSPPPSSGTLSTILNMEGHSLRTFLNQQYPKRFNLRRIQKLLKIKSEEVLIAKCPDYPEWGIKNEDLGVLLCEECTKLAGSLSELYSELELLQMKLNQSLQQVLEVIKTSELEEPSRMQFLKNEMIKDFFTSHLVDAVETLRRKTTNKGCKYLDGSMPRVCLTRWRSPDPVPSEEGTATSRPTTIEVTSSSSTLSKATFSLSSGPRSSPEPVPENALLQTQDLIQSNNRTKPDGLKFKCTLCPAVCGSKMGLSIHKLRRHKGSQEVTVVKQYHKCFRCGAQLSSKPDWIRHTRLYCPKLVSMLKSRNSNTSTHIAPYSQQIQTTNPPDTILHRSATTKTPLLDNGEMSVEKRCHKCYRCGAKFSSKPDWIRHTRLSCPKLVSMLKSRTCNMSVYISPYSHQIQTTNSCDTSRSSSQETTDKNSLRNPKSNLAPTTANDATSCTTATLSPNISNTTAVVTRTPTTSDIPIVNHENKNHWQELPSPHSLRFHNEINSNSLLKPGRYKCNLCWIPFTSLCSLKDHYWRKHNVRIKISSPAVNGNRAEPTNMRQDVNKSASITIPISSPAHITMIPIPSQTNNNNPHQPLEQCIVYSKHQTITGPNKTANIMTPALYKCKYCGMAFGSTSGLKRHCNRRHDMPAASTPPSVLVASKTTESSELTLRANTNTPENVGGFCYPSNSDAVTPVVISSFSLAATAPASSQGSAVGEVSSSNFSCNDCGETFLSSRFLRRHQGESCPERAMTNHYPSSSGGAATETFNSEYFGQGDEVDEEEVFLYSADTKIEVMEMKQVQLPSSK